MKHTNVKYSAENTGQTREYPTAEAAQFVEDIYTVAAHGGGSANLSTNDPGPFISPGMLVESDRQIHAAIREPRAGQLICLRKGASRSGIVPVPRCCVRLM